MAATLAITHAAMVIMLTRDNSDSVYSINNFIHMWQCSTAVIAITDAVKSIQSCDNNHVPGNGDHIYSNTNQTCTMVSAIAVTYLVMTITHKAIGLMSIHSAITIVCTAALAAVVVSCSWLIILLNTRDTSKSQITMWYVTEKLDNSF